MSPEQLDEVIEVIEAADSPIAASVEISMIIERLMAHMSLPIRMAMAEYLRSTADRIELRRTRPREE
jgi:hypothetical protein